MFIYTKTCNLVLSDVLIVFIIDGALPLYARNNNRAHRSVILKVLYRVLLLNGRWPFCRGPPACLRAQLQFIMCFYSKTHSNSLQLQAFEKKKNTCMEELLEQALKHQKNANVTAYLNLENSN